MNIIGTGIDLGILWLLIVLFTRSTDSEQSYREAFIVVFGVMIVGMVSSFFLGEWFAIIPTLVALYYLVDWACGDERRVTIKICGWYLVASIATHASMIFLAQPR
jgi:hypothetical protein